MSNITIFEEPSSVPTVQRESRRMDRMSSGGGGSTMRRIQLSNGRTFKRVINGEQIGKAATDTLDVIIVDWLVEPSRKFYAAAYDKDAKATLPDCWSNDGVAPEAGASNKQSKACASCPKNVKGSGTGGKGKACRYERRLAVLVAGDPSGDIYQIAIPGASLFSDNDGNVYGFEGYKKFLLANNEALDTVITTIIYDTSAPTVKVGFKPFSRLKPDQVLLVDAAQNDPATERYIKLSVATVDAAPALPAPAPEPVAVIAEAPAAPLTNPFGDDEDEMEEAPVKRPAKKEAVAAAPKPELKEALGAWLDDDED
jgi:hypothetical protein